jgi:hypothetical protein
MGKAEMKPYSISRKSYIEPDFLSHPKLVRKKHEEILHLQIPVRFRWLSEFKKEIVETVYEEGCRKRLDPMCKDLKEAGYKEIWVGGITPDQFQDVVVASPKVRITKWPPLWVIADYFFPVSSGRTFRDADMVYLKILLPKSLLGRRV